jgi:hypothetical protein
MLRKVWGYRWWLCRKWRMRVGMWWWERKHRIRFCVWKKLCLGIVWINLCRWVCPRNLRKEIDCLCICSPMCIWGSIRSDISIWIPNNVIDIYSLLFYIFMGKKVKSFLCFFVRFWEDFVYGFYVLEIMFTFFFEV